MKLINININEYFHMIPLWKSPIKLPVEATRGKLPVESYPWAAAELQPPLWALLL